MSSLTFLSHTSILQFLIAYFSFVSDYKDLKLTLIINSTLNLICIYGGRYLFELTCLLMSKKLNNDVSKDSPVWGWGGALSFSSWYNNANQFSSLPRDPVSSGRQHTAGQPYSRLGFCKLTLLYLQRVPYHPTLLRICPVDCIGKPHIRN